MKRYRTHRCERAHRSAVTMARCVWPWAHWVSGYTHGQFASVSKCRGTTVMLHATAEDAVEAVRVIDAGACGGACIGRHEVIQLVLPSAVVMASTERAAA